MLGLHYYSSLKVTLVTFLLSVLLTVSSSSRQSFVDAFVVSRAPSFRTRLSFRTSLNSMMSTDSSLVVISPPGGVGEVTAVKAATMGAHVKWFVVSNNNNSSSKLQLSPYSLDSIQNNNGSIDLAGCDVDSVNESLQAIQLYCRESNALVCTTDGIDNVAPGKLNEQDPVLVWKNAIKIAAKQAAESIKKGGMKVVILSVDDEEDEEDGKQGNLLLKSLFKSGSGVDIPSSLSAAMMGGGDKNVIKIRHGELFGIPESSPNFSALTGGPLKDAILCEEYTMRSVRMDPSQTLSGSVSGLNSRSSRHAIGEAAALFALTKLLASNNNLDVCVTSLRGIDPVSMETWEDELERVKTMIQSGQGAPLFTASFSSVPDVERLADWLATKWAPAVMRTYDIAAIRVGARPVYATRIGDSQVEIVWQQLDNFESVTAGKMLIDVSNDGIVATRAAGDASKGYGTVSRKPLAGENVLVSKLADAASQAIEKGLAKKPATAKKPKPEKKKVEVAVPVSSVQASGTVQAAAEPSLESGPRTAGARRSSERARGSKRTKKTAAGASDDDSAFQ